MTIGSAAIGGVADYFTGGVVSLAMARRIVLFTLLFITNLLNAQQEHFAVYCGNFGVLRHYNKSIDNLADIINRQRDTAISQPMSHYKTGAVLGVHLGVSKNKRWRGLGLSFSGTGNECKAIFAEHNPDLLTYRIVTHCITPYAEYGYQFRNWFGVTGNVGAGWQSLKVQVEGQSKNIRMNSGIAPQLGIAAVFTLHVPNNNNALIDNTAFQLRPFCSYTLSSVSTNKLHTYFLGNDVTNKKDRTDALYIGFSLSVGIWEKRDQ